MGLSDAEHEEVTPNAECLLISQLTCSLVGEQQRIHLTTDGRARQICGTETLVTEYFCNYGLNPDFYERLAASDLVLSGIGEDGDVRLVELPQQRFFIATLFLPQMSSTPAQPHPLITAYLQAAHHSVKSENRSR